MTDYIALVRDWAEKARVAKCPGEVMADGRILTLEEVCNFEIYEGPDPMELRLARLEGHTGNPLSSITIETGTIDCYEGTSLTVWEDGTWIATGNKMSFAECLDSRGGAEGKFEDDGTELQTGLDLFLSTWTGEPDEASHAFGYVTMNDVLSLVTKIKEEES